MVEAVIFDYNGVIADDERLHEQAFQNVMQAYGVNLDQEEYETYCMGKTDTDGFVELKEAFQNEIGNISLERLMRDKQAFYFSAAKETEVLFPGAKDIIQTLGAKFQLTIVSSSSAEEIDVVLENNDLKRFFSYIVTADDVERGKPDPEGYLKALSLLGTSASTTRVIEDSSTGVKAAKQAGLPCVAVLHISEREKLSEADLILEDIQVLVRGNSLQMI